MAMPPQHFDREEREIEFSRALAFSDGVFAFAITLLVVSIDVPRLTGADLEGQLVGALDDLAPFMFSYFLSFAVVGVLWLRHHRLFSRIVKLDTHALVVNLVLLSFVALMPFSTEVIGRYGELPAGVSIYAANLAAATGAATWLWWHCARGGLLGEEQSGRQLRGELLSRLWTTGGFLLSIPVAFAASAGVAQLMWLVVMVTQVSVLRRYAQAATVEPGRGPVG